MGISFRVEQASENWNAPAYTAYGIAMNPLAVDCSESGLFWQAGLVQFGAYYNHWFVGTGCCSQNDSESSRTFLELTDKVFFDAPNHYAVEVVASNIKFWVNGALVFDYTDNTVPYTNGATPITYGGIQFDWDWESRGWVDNVIVTDMSD